MFKRMFVVACAIAALAAAASAEPLTAQGVENRFIVGLRAGVSMQEGRVLIEARGLKVLREAGEPMRLLLVEAQPGRARIESESLKALAQVRDVQPDLWQKWIEDAALPEFPAVEQVLPALPKIKSSAAAPKDANADEVQWGVRRVNAPGAWAQGNEGAGVKVCVVDTGIDDTVPDLQGQVVAGEDFVDQPKDWRHGHFHGTHVAGIVAAKRDGKGVVGVAPRAQLMAAKVLNKEGQGGVFSIIQGVMWCAQNQAQVINMSLGAPQSIPFLEDVINMAVQQGVTVVAAAGNGDGHGGPSPVNYPGAYPSVIAISALSDTDGITPWSSRGPQVAFIAPGLKIPSTVPHDNDSSYVHAYSGTSMASPHVAGLAALAVARGAHGKDAVKAKLLAAAEKLPNLPQTEQGNGVINAAKIR